tara:strand:- start:434 stop:1378 length:945 start_codon:yes stop_codon:yes gene_type:complete
MHISEKELRRMIRKELLREIGMPTDPGDPSGSDMMIDYVSKWVNTTVRSHAENKKVNIAWAAIFKYLIGDSSPMTLSAFKSRGYVPFLHELFAQAIKPHGSEQGAYGYRVKIGSGPKDYAVFCQIKYDTYDAVGALNAGIPGIGDLKLRANQSLDVWIGKWMSFGKALRSKGSRKVDTDDVMARLFDEELFTAEPSLDDLKVTIGQAGAGPKTGVGKSIGVCADPEMAIWHPMFNNGMWQMRDKFDFANIVKRVIDELARQMGTKPAVFPIDIRFSSQIGSLTSDEIMSYPDRPGASRNLCIATPPMVPEFDIS